MLKLHLRRLETSDATIGAVQKARLDAQQAKYERKHGKIIKNGATHLVCRQRWL